MSDGYATSPRGAFCDWTALPSSPSWPETLGVHTTPGDTELTRIPLGPSSTAAVRTSDMSPALAAPYGAWRGAEVSPDADVTNTNTPPSVIVREPICSARNACRRFIA